MEIILAPGRSERNYWRDLWRFRELFLVLAWRDVAVRYKQTVVGIAWAIVRPFLTTVLFTIVFGRLAKLPTEAVAPYPIMVFAGMLPWFLFSTVLSEASNSLVSNANLVGKVYFPRLIIPISSSAAALVDCGINIGGLALIMGWYGYAPHPQIVFLPAFVLLAFMASLGPALFLTGLNVKYRDFRYIIPFILQFGLYVSPVGFSTAVVPEKWRFWYRLNPLVSVIDGFRWCVVGGTLHWLDLGMSVGITTLCLWLGVAYFRRTEKAFADLL